MSHVSETSKFRFSVVYDVFGSVIQVEKADRLLCRDDAVNRVFPYQISFLDNNTATNCLGLCSKYGYGAGGMEYSNECCKFPFSLRLHSTSLCILCCEAMRLNLV